jgi:hypothetical protein
MLWNLDLSAELTLGPVMDGAGNFVLALAGSKVALVSPYGSLLGLVGCPAAPSAIGAFQAKELTAAIGFADGSVGFLAPGSSKIVGPAAPLGGKPILDLASDGASLFALDAGGGLEALGADGARRWLAATTVPEGRIALAPARLVVAGRGRAVSLSYGGEILRQADITNAVSGGLLSPSGLLFSAGADWILAAYRFETTLERLGAPEVPPYPAETAAVDSLRGFDPLIAEGDRQLVLIADIEKSLDSATIGGQEPGDRAVLAAIARGDFGADYVPQSRRRFRVSTLAEAEACRLLGRIGSPASIEDLAGIAGSKADPSVRASALDALGRIGVDPEGRSRAAFAGVLEGSGLDEEVAVALIGAIEAMARRSGAPPSVDAARALLGLSGPPYSQAVRDRAVAALGRIAQGF